MEERGWQAKIIWLRRGFHVKKIAVKGGGGIKIITFKCCMMASILVCNFYQNVYKSVSGVLKIKIFPGVHTPGHHYIFYVMKSIPPII